MFLKLTLFLWLDVCQHIFAAVSFNCYSCTYILSGDSKLDYECANQPWNVTKGLSSLSCTAPYQCVTRVSLSQGKTHIRSVTRTCLPQDPLCSGERCCNENGVYPTCEHKCREDMCNNRNAEEWLSQGNSSGAVGVHNFVVKNILPFLAFLSVKFI